MMLNIIFGCVCVCAPKGHTMRNNNRITKSITLSQIHPCHEASNECCFQCRASHSLGLCSSKVPSIFRLKSPFWKGSKYTLSLHFVSKKLSESPRSIVKKTIVSCPQKKMGLLSPLSAVKTKEKVARWFTKDPLRL